jgi:hypothetical protein
MESNTLTMNQKRELIRQIIQGQVNRADFPTVFRHSVKWFSDPVEPMDATPVMIPEENKKRLIRAVLTDTLNEDAYPEIFEGIYTINITWPEGD